MKESLAIIWPDNTKTKVLLYLIALLYTEAGLFLCDSCLQSNKKSFLRERKQSAINAVRHIRP